MDENHQDKTEGKTPATEGKSPLSPLSSQNKRGTDQLLNNQMEVTIKQLRDRGYKVTEEYSNTGQLSKVSAEQSQRKTLWDWLQLLIIPLLIAALGIGFTEVQNQTSLQIAKDNRAQDLQIAKDTQEEATLKAYLDDMTTLLLDKKLGSQVKADKAASDEAAAIARTKTLTTLSRLTDPQRKARVLQFLYEAHLIGSQDITTGKRYGQIIDLSGADLSYANLIGATLSGADLSYANLSRASLGFAILAYTDLSYANLSYANLSGALLALADLHSANLSYAILSGATLYNADLHNAILSKATVTNKQLAHVKSLQDAIMPDGSRHP